MACLVLGAFVITTTVLVTRSVEINLSLHDIATYPQCMCTYPPYLTDFKHVRSWHEDHRIHVHVRVNCSDFEPNANVTFQATITYPEEPHAWSHHYADFGTWPRHMAGQTHACVIRSEQQIIRDFVTASPHSVFPANYTKFRGWSYPPLVTRKMEWAGYWYLLACAMLVVVGGLIGCCCSRRHNSVLPS